MLLAVVLMCVWHISVGNNLTMEKTRTFSEHELHKRLFKDYNPDIIPNLNKSRPIVLDIEFFMIAIDNIDEKKQTLSVRAFLSVEWKDDLITWDESEFPGVRTINIKNEDIWLPDLSLNGALDSLSDIGQKGGRSFITSHGEVTMWPYKLFSIACKISVAKFPIDEQTCTFDFLSWTNPNTIIHLRNPSGKINMDFMSESGEWEAVSLDTTIRLNTFGPDEWDHLEFNLLLRRKWLFYALNMMTPVVCISLLNVLCFLLPAQSGERVTLCISIFLTLAVFLTVINNSMPESSEEVAVFGVYVGLQLIGSALTIFCTVLSIYFFHKKTPGNVPLLFRGFARMCCIDTGRREVRDIKYNVGNNIPDAMESKSTKTGPVTWVSVSLALDRLCFHGAICWHALLLFTLIMKLNM